MTGKCSFTPALIPGALVRRGLYRVFLYDWAYTVYSLRLGLYCFVLVQVCLIQFGLLQARCSLRFLFVRPDDQPECGVIGNETPEPVEGKFPLIPESCNRNDMDEQPDNPGKETLEKAFFR